jgi:hypothetical protein
MLFELKADSPCYSHIVIAVMIRDAGVLSIHDVRLEEKRP